MKWYHVVVTTDGDEEYETNVEANGIADAMEQATGLFAMYDAMVEAGEDGEPRQ